MTTPSALANYSLAQAQTDVANLRGQIAHLTARAEILQLIVDTSLTMAGSSTVTLPDGSTWTSSLLNIRATTTIDGPDSSLWTSTGIAMASGKVITSDTWHAMSGGLAAGYAAGTPAPFYTFEPIGAKGRVRLRGQVTLTANQAAATTFFTLPAAYIPASKKALPFNSNNLSGISYNNGYVTVDTSGNLIEGSAGSNGNVFWLDGLTFDLDS